MNSPSPHRTKAIPLLQSKGVIEHPGLTHLLGRQGKHVWLIVQLPIKAGGWDAPLVHQSNLQALRLCASSYFYLIISWEMTRGNDLNGKHDEWKFSELIIVWVGTILDWIFLIGIIRLGNFWMGVILVGNFPGGNCMGGSYPVWEFRIGANFPGGNCPVGIIWVAILTERIIQLFWLERSTQKLSVSAIKCCSC